MKQDEIELLVRKGGKPIKMWAQGVPVEAKARQVLEKPAQLSILSS